MKGDGGMTFKERAGDERVGEALRRLDGNAAAGILSEVFIPDLTTARATCANCGATRAMGALLVYSHGMGTVMRCPSCDAVVLRVAHPRKHLWLDLSGAKLVVITADEPSSRSRKHRRSFLPSVLRSFSEALFAVLPGVGLSRTHGITTIFPLSSWDSIRRFASWMSSQRNTRAGFAL